MKIMVLGANGYCGEPIAKYLSDKGHEVIAVDNYYKRDLMVKLKIKSLSESKAMYEAFKNHKIIIEAIDVSEGDTLYKIIKKYDPDTIIHLAQNPSAPYSMAGEDCVAISIQQVGSGKVASTFFNGHNASHASHVA